MRVGQKLVKTRKLGAHERGERTACDLIAGNLLHLRMRDAKDGNLRVDCLDGIDQVA